VLDGYVQPSQIDDEIGKMLGKYKGGEGRENIAIQKARGVIETQVRPWSRRDHGRGPDFFKK